MLAKLLKSELVTTCPQVRVLGRSDASVLASAREHSEHRRHPTLLASANIFTEVVLASHVKVRAEGLYEKGEQQRRTT